MEHEGRASTESRDPVEYWTDALVPPFENAVLIWKAYVYAGTHYGDPIRNTGIKLSVRALQKNQTTEVFRQFWAMSGPSGVAVISVVPILLKFQSLTLAPIIVSLRFAKLDVNGATSPGSFDSFVEGFQATVQWTSGSPQ